MLASSAVQFGPWIPLDSLLGAAPSANCPALPHTAGLFQLRSAQGLLQYPLGKSTMVAYGAGADVGAALAELWRGPVGQRAAALGPLLVRFAVADAHSTPASHLARLHARFEAQFGSPPLAEVAPSAPAAAPVTGK